MKKGNQHWFTGLISWFHTAQARCSLIALVSFILLCGVFYMGCAPKRYSLTVGSISRQTITATQSVVDEITTEERKNAAANSIEPTYRLDESVAPAVMADLADTFAELRKVQQYGLASQETDDEGNAVSATFTDEEIAYAQSLVTSITLTRYQTTTLLRVAAEDFDTMVQMVTRAVENALNTGIREGRVSDSISTIQQIVGYRVDITLMQIIVPAVLRSCITPNMVVDQETTEQARNKARESVENIVYQQGQNIIREGEVVTASQYAMVKQLGLLENGNQDYTSYLGVTILVLFAMFVLIVFLRLYRPEILHDLRYFSLENLILVITMALCLLASKVWDIHIAPVCLGAILIGSLIGWRAALPAAVSISFMVCGFAAGGSTHTMTEMMHLSLMNLMGLAVSALFLRGKGGRLRPLICSLLVAIANGAIMIFLGLMTGSSMETYYGYAQWAAIGAVLSGLLAIGLQPLFEVTYNLATPAKLLELANPNHPLLRRLLLEAPGTYHHSIIVANLAEAAAEKINGNALLARAGAYFHDVGKLKRPSYFKENQQGINPLDQTDPYVSAAIVTTHTRDGLQLAQKYRLPPEIQDIIIQHHGDTPVMFFYLRACKNAGDREVDIDDFRYDGTRPTSKEAAIVMLADTVEAAVRSMKDPSPQEVMDFIQKLVRGKLDDGQLNNSPLSLKDIQDICEAFFTVLNGVFHERIEYPKGSVPLRSIKVENVEKNRPESAGQEKSAEADENAEKKKTDPEKQGDTEQEKPDQEK